MALAWSKASQKKLGLSLFKVKNSFHKNSWRFGKSYRSKATNYVLLEGLENYYITCSSLSAVKPAEASAFSIHVDNQLFLEVEVVDVSISSV